MQPLTPLWRAGKSRRSQSDFSRWRRAVLKRTALLASLILLAGCATSGPVPSDPCGPFRPIYVAKDDVLTEQTARDLLAHNRTGRELCGWGR